LGHATVSGAWPSMTSRGMHRIGRPKQLRAVPTLWRSCRSCGGGEFTSPVEQTDKEFKSRLFLRKDGGKDHRRSGSIAVRHGERLEDGSGAFVENVLTGILAKRTVDAIRKWPGLNHRRNKVHRLGVPGGRKRLNYPDSTCSDGWGSSWLLWGSFRRQHVLILISSGLSRHLFYLRTSLKYTFDMTFQTKAYFDLVFGVDSLAELPVPRTMLQAPTT
jgi:hypothetical protein